MHGGTKGRRGTRTDNQMFVDALSFMARFEVCWRDLPEECGHYQSLKRRYHLWTDMSILDDILAALAQEADLEGLVVAPTTGRALQFAAEARTDNGGGGGEERMSRAWAGLATA